MHRVRGNLLLAIGEQAAAANSYRRATGVAKEKRAKFWELRAALGLARLWGNDGKSKEAHDLLEPVCGWFTEGLDTRDLKDAHMVLANFA